MGLMSFCILLTVVKVKADCGSGSESHPTAALNLSDIKQGASETAARYIFRVIKIISEVRDLAPAALPELAQPFCDESEP